MPVCSTPFQPPPNLEGIRFYHLPECSVQQTASGPSDIRQSSRMKSFRSTHRLVDAMKKVQGWTDTSILHFRNLAIFGEQIILGIRYGNWNSVYEPVHAVNWARYWRPQVQGYLHAYRSVTGVDLSIDVTNARIDSTMPSAL